MIFQLLSDFADARAAMPRAHPRYRLLSVLNEAILRDLHFIDRHRATYPQGLFQTIWNYGWWFDCLEASAHYALQPGDGKQTPPWKATVPRACDLLQQWSATRDKLTPGASWFRALRPPSVASGSGLRATFKFERGIVAMAVSHDGIKMVSATRSTIHLTNLRTGEDCIIRAGHSRRIQRIALSPDGSTLAVGFDDGSIGSCDADAGGTLSIIARHSRSIRCLAISPSGKEVASSAEFAPEIRVWQAGTKVERVINCGDGSTATTLGFSDDGRWIAFGANDGVVGLWQYEANDQPLLFQQHQAPLAHVAVSGDASLLGSISLDGNICMRHLGTGQVNRCSLTDVEDFRRYRFSPDLDRVACGSWQGVVRLVELPSGTDLAAFPGHDDEVTALVFLSDGNTVASASMDKSIHLWDVTGIKRLPLRAAEFKKSRLSFSADGQRLVCLGDSRDAPGTGQGNAILIWSTVTGALDQVLHSDHQLSAVSLSARGEMVAAGTLEDSVLLWTLGAGNPPLVLHAPYLASPRCVVFSADAMMLAAETWHDFSVWIWDTATGAQRCSLKGHTAAIQGIAFRHDRGEVLTAAKDQTVRVWDAASGACLQVLPQAAAVLCVAPSANGKWIACGLADGSTCVWNVESSTPRLHTRLMGHTDGVERVWFSQQSQQLVCANHHAIFIWNPESGKLLRAISHTDQELSEKAVDTGLVVAAMPAVADEVVTSETVNLFAGASGFSLFLARLVGDVPRIDLTLP